jgi:hypothetical protein
MTKEPESNPDIDVKIVQMMWRMRRASEELMGGLADDPTHAPGPWSVAIDGEKWVISYHTPGTTAEREQIGNRLIPATVANARMIKAAPALYDGCIAALAYLVDPGSPFPENRKAATEIIRAAVRLAETGAE